MSLLNATVQNISEFVIIGFDTLDRKQAVGFVLLLIYVLAMLANITILCIVATDKRLHQPMYIFMCNLAIVDMLYISSSCPGMIRVLLAGHRSIAFIPCIIQMCFFQVGTVMEMFAIAVMALDRLIAIKFPLRYGSMLSSGRTALIAAFLWILAFASLSIPANILPLPFCSNIIQYVFCDPAAVVRATCVNPNPYFDLISTLTFVLLFGTFSFICLSYVKIMFTVFRMNANDKKKMFHTCFTHFIVIVCFYAPVFVRVVLTRVGVVLTAGERNGLVVAAVLVPSVINPFIYCFRTREIRHKIMQIMSQVTPKKCDDL